MNWLKALYYRYRELQALHDVQYFQEETARCVANVQVARDRVAFFQKRQMECKYPVRGSVNRC